jgi:hypothetical protein
MNITDDLEFRWYYDQFDLDSLPELATRALMDGYDGKAVRELAWKKESWQEAGPLLDQALNEIGIMPLPNPDATLRVAKQIASQVVSGKITPYVGALRLSPMWLPNPFPGQDTIASLAGQIEEARSDEIAQELEVALRNEMKKLLT